MNCCSEPVKQWFSKWIPKISSEIHRIMASFFELAQTIRDKRTRRFKSILEQDEELKTLHKSFIRIFEMFVWEWIEVQNLQLMKNLRQLICHFKWTESSLLSNCSVVNGTNLSQFNRKFSRRFGSPIISFTDERSSRCWKVVTLGDQSDSRP